MKIKLLNAKPLLISGRNMPNQLKLKITQNIEKLQEAIKQPKTRNFNLESNSARMASSKSAISNRFRSRSKANLKKDPIHEKKLLRELIIFRREVEVRYRNSKANKTYEYPRHTFDSENNLTYDDIHKLKEDICNLLTQWQPFHIKHKETTIPIQMKQGPNNYVHCIPSNQYI